MRGRLRWYIYRCTPNQLMRLGKKDTYISSRVRHILVPLKTCGVMASSYMGRPRPFPIYGHNPPGTDVTKKLKSIYGQDDAIVAVWLTVKEFPAPRRPNMVPLSLEYDSSHSTVPSAWWLKTEGWHPCWYVFTNHKTTNRRKREKWFKIDIIINSHIPLPPFFPFTITDSMKTKTCVNPYTIKKHWNTDIFIHTHFFFNPCF